MLLSVVLSEVSKSQKIGFDLSLNLALRGKR